MKTTLLIKLIAAQDHLVAAGIKTLNRAQLAAAVVVKERIRCRDLATLMRITSENCLSTAKTMEKDGLLRIEVSRTPKGKRTAWVLPTPYLKDVFMGIAAELNNNNNNIYENTTT